MNSLISIIIPIYNVEYFLRKCITSVLNQDFTDFELILVNDGSTDSSGKIVNEFISIDNRIKLFNKDNGGVSSARNLGLSKASGKWVYFLDADDYLNNNVFSELKNILLNENVEMIFGNFNYVNKKNEILDKTNNRTFKKNGSDVILEYGLWKHKIVMGAYFVRREIIEKNNLFFNENSKYAEDTEFINYCLLNSFQVISTDTYFFNYVTHDNSAIASINFSRFDVFKSKQRIYKYIVANYPHLIEERKMFSGFLLPEAIIDTVELLCKKGISLKKIQAYLKKNNYYQNLSEEYFNNYTTKAYRKKIIFFKEKPFLFWLNYFTLSKKYEFRVYLSKNIKRLI